MEWFDKLPMIVWHHRPQKDTIYQRVSNLFNGAMQRQDQRTSFTERPLGTAALRIKRIHPGSLCAKHKLGKQTGMTISPSTAGYVTLYTISAVIVLDNEGHRLLAKYYQHDELGASKKRQSHFEGVLYNRTRKVLGSIKKVRVALL